MSTTSSRAGIAIRIKDEHQNTESLTEIAKILGYSDEEIKENIEEGYFEIEKNKWHIGYDHNGVKGFVFTIEDEYEAFDVNTKLTLEQINTILGSLLDLVPPVYVDKSADKVSIFSILYYNGSESPFTF